MFDHYYEMWHAHLHRAMVKTASDEWYDAFRPLSFDQFDTLCRKIEYDTKWKRLTGKE